MDHPRILIAEDTAELREIIRLQLTAAGYEVHEAEDGRAALEKARQVFPDVILLDVMMPNMDGYEACRQLRGSFLTRHIPIIMLTAKEEMGAKVEGLQYGANDYITKPWAPQELFARVRGALEWSRQQRSASPLTGLPGNLSIEEEVRRRLDAGGPFAMLQVDIDHFKSFNDYYGYSRGDLAIQTLARILVDNAEHHGAGKGFVGHIGGDDFVILTSPAGSEQMARGIVADFDRAARELYDQGDRARGHIEVLNRRRALERFPIMSVTIALVRTDHLPVAHQAELSDVANELKAHGKSLAGSVVVTERRSRGEPGEGSVQQVA